MSLDQSTLDYQGEELSKLVRSRVRIVTPLLGEDDTDEKISDGLDWDQLSIAYDYPALGFPGHSALEPIWNLEGMGFQFPFCMTLTPDVGHGIQSGGWALLGFAGEFHEQWVYASEYPTLVLV